MYSIGAEKQNNKREILCPKNGRSPLFICDDHRTYAKAILACGGMVLFVFVYRFFALQGEKTIHKG